MYNKLLLSLSLLTLSIPGVSLAQATLKLGNPTLKVATLKDFIYLMIRIIQLVGIPVLTCAIIYAGFMLVTAGGNEEQVTKAKRWILWTLVGAAIILSAQSIADMVYGTAALF